VLVATVGALQACEPAMPDKPSYATDVRPLLVAHCIRCHGAGGTLQGDPAAYPLGVQPPGYRPGPPKQCYFDEVEDRGDCTATDGGVSVDCKSGLRSCAALVGLYILPASPKPMPPPPAMLNDWERDVLVRWSKNPTF
jgi:hypothetical protein